jgi:hypothetical protein
MTKHDDDENARPRAKQLDPYKMRQFSGSEHWYRFGLDRAYGSAGLVPALDLVRSDNRRR